MSSQSKESQMTRYQLDIIANNNPVVLEKLLQVARYRGFAVDKLAVIHYANSTTNITELLINLSVQSTNTVELLIRQLDKVFDITQVQLAHLKDSRPKTTIQQTCC